MQLTLHRRPLRSAAPVLLAAAFLASCTDSDDLLDGPPPIPPGLQTNNILDVAGDLGLTTFVDLAERSSFTAELRNAAPITVFLPSEAALTDLGTTRLAELRDPARLDELDAFVGRLLVAGDFDTALLGNFSTLVTATGDVLGIDALSGVLFVDEGRIVGEDNSADNGRIYVLDAAPEPAESPIASLERSGLTTMVQLIDAAGLRADVNANRYTILAPTEAAFAALPAGELDALQQPGSLPELLARLRLHLIDGAQPAARLANAGRATTEEGTLLVFGGVADAMPTANGALLSRTNRPTTTGGLVHECDAFLEVPPTLTEALDLPNLSVLETLVLAAALDTELESTVPLTLFAPDDSAFGALPAGVIDDLVMPQNLATLQELLRSHGVVAARGEDRFSAGDMLGTLAGTTLSFTDDGALLIDGIARITTADVFVRNGVVHVIDAVLAADGL